MENVRCHLLWTRGVLNVIEGYYGLVLYLHKEKYVLFHASDLQKSVIRKHDIINCLRFRENQSLA